MRGSSLGPIFFQFFCSFWDKITKILDWRPKCGIGVPVWEIQNPSLPTNDFPLRIQISGKGLLRAACGSVSGLMGKWVSCNEC